MSVGLRDAAETATRERSRLQSRSRIERLGRKVAFLGSEEAAQAGLRYRPVAWLAIALVAIAFFFPGRHDAQTETAAFVPAPSARSITPSTSTTQLTTPTTLPVPSATFSSPPATSFVPSATSTTTTTTTALVALTVRGFGWASSLSGVPSNDVPDGTMPVGNRLGNLDKASFVRLSGTAATLTLHEDTSGAREAIGTGAVMACRITEPGWREAPDQPIADAPAWDANACVKGTERDDTWTFDLSGFADVAGQAGFALVPAPDAPADFQLTFSTT